MIETAQNLIDGALRLIGVYSTGTVITPEEYESCLTIMNRMLDRWNLTDLLVYSKSITTFPFIAGKAFYTLGTGGDFDMPRPAKLERISVQIPGSSGYNMEMPLDADFNLESWQSLVVKSTPSIFPLACYNNPNFPFMELNFWPIPQGPASVVLYTWDLMPLISDLADNVELPNGYSDAVVYNLAVRLAQIFDRMPSPELLAEAKASKHDINDINNGTPSLHTDPMWSGRNGNGSIAAKTWGRVVL